MNEQGMLFTIYPNLFIEWIVLHADRMLCYVPTQLFIPPGSANEDSFGREGFPLMD